MANIKEQTTDSEFGKDLFKEMSQSILPIVAKTDNGKMEGVGSCTLLNTNEQNYIVSAAHILRDWGKYELYISTNEKFIAISSWSFDMTEEGNQDCDYTLDLAFSKISEINTSLFENHSAILIEGYNKNTIPYDNEVLFAFGYPSSKIKYDKHKKQFKIVPFQYFGKEINDIKLYKESCSYEDDHLLINFVKRKTKIPNTNGYTIAPDTYGISGGGLFRVLFKDSKPEIFILEGILTEWHRDLNLMKCARIAKVKQTILCGS